MGTLTRALLIFRAQCPGCSGTDLHTVHRHGFWEAGVLRVVGIRPFRCRDCGRRFYRFSVNGETSKRKVKKRQRTQEVQWPTQGPNEEEFKKLIAEISEAEKKIFGNGEIRQPGLFNQRSDEAEEVSAEHVEDPDD